MVTIITLKTDWPIEDFAAERNKLLEAAPEGWVLFLDSDEKLSKELSDEVLRCTQDDSFDGYLIKRVDFFLGRWLRFGETGNIKLVRLGKRGAGQWKRKVHEYWDIKNPGELKNPILHTPHPTITAFIDKINFYSGLDAVELGPHFAKASRGERFLCFGKPIAKFFLNYFLRLGFLDGEAGFVHAFMMSFQSLVVRVKQYEKTSNFGGGG